MYVLTLFQVLKGDIRPAIETHEILYQVMQKHNFLPEVSLLNLFFFKYFFLLISHLKMGTTTNRTKIYDSHVVLRSKGIMSLLPMYFNFFHGYPGLDILEISFAVLFNFIISVLITSVFIIVSFLLKCLLLF